MRRIAVTAAVGTLACLLLYSWPLPAKPTRTIARSARLAAPPATLRSSRARAAQKTAAARRGTRLDSPHSGAASQSPRSRELAGAHAPAPVQTHLRTSKRERTLAAQSGLAARSAILAADRKATHTAGREPGAPTSATAPSPKAASDSALLVNDGGVLRTIPGQCLKPVEEDAATPALLSPLSVASLPVSSLYDSLGRLMLPPPLYGSREVLLHQNEMADRDGLTRVRDDADLLDLRREKKLVPLPESAALTVDYRLPEDRRYSRPWTASFLSVLAHDFYASFHSPLQVDSAVRTVAVQRRLVRTNGNAAPVT